MYYLYVISATGVYVEMDSSMKLESFLVKLKMSASYANGSVTNWDTNVLEWWWITSLRITWIILFVFSFTCVQ